MNLKQMEYILEIYRCGGVHAAARKLYISQPALSQHLQRAEDELGIRIFERGTRSMKVTFDGQKCLDSFERILYEYEQLENWIDESHHLSHGSLTIGIPPVRAMQFLPLLLPEFKKSFPGIKIQLRELPSADLPAAIRRGDVDLALFIVERFAADLCFIPLAQETLWLAVEPGSEADRICQQSVEQSGQIDLRLLSDQPFLMLPKGSNLRSQADELFSRYRIHPKTALETATVDLSVTLAASGIGLFIVSEVFLYFSRSDYQPKVYSLAHDTESYRLGIAYHPSHYQSRAMNEFIEFTKNVTAKLPFSCV